jgi:Leucine-rich repeat (LRR) protein
MELNDYCDTDVKDISPLAELESLEALYMTAMVVDGIEPLSNLKNLTHLEFNTESTDDLSPLFGLKNLQKVVLAGNNLNYDQIDALREALPETEIEIPAEWGV